MVPEPFLMILPPVPEIAPAEPEVPKFSPAGLARVSVPAPRAIVPPAPDTDLTVSLRPARSNVPPAIKEIRDVSGITWLAPMDNLPATIETSPKELAGPLRRI